MSKEEKREIRAYVDWCRRVYSKPFEAASLKEAMDKFDEQRYHMYGDIVYDENFDHDPEEVCIDCGVKEFVYADEEDEEWCEEEDSMNQEEYAIAKGTRKPQMSIDREEYFELRDKARLAEKYKDVIEKLEAKKED